MRSKRSVLIVFFIILALSFEGGSRRATADEVTHLQDAHPSHANGCDTTPGGQAQKTPIAPDPASLQQMSQSMTGQQRTALAETLRETSAPSPRSDIAPSPTSTPGPGQFIDPYLSWPCGSDVTLRNGSNATMSFWWKYFGNKIIVFVSDEGGLPGPTEYYGFDAHGSYLHSITGPFIYSYMNHALTQRAERGANLTMEAPPDDLITTGSTKTKNDPGWTEYDRQSKNAKIEKQHDGSFILSYTADPAIPRNLKSFTVRPAAVTPAEASLSATVSAKMPDYYRQQIKADKAAYGGRYVWIGTGSEAGQARLFSYDYRGTVDWEIVSPSMAKSILRGTP